MRRCKNMKFLTNRKRLCFWVVPILLVGVLLPACAASSAPPTEVTDELLAQIEKDYAEYQYANGANPEIDGPWPIEYCYGIYNGCVAVMFSEPAFCMGWEDEVADSVFRYRDGSFIYIWNNGTFERITEAYEQGLLSKEDVAMIAEIHDNVRYTTNDN